MDVAREVRDPGGAGARRGRKRGAPPDDTPSPPPPSCTLFSKAHVSALLRPSSQQTPSPKPARLFQLLSLPTATPTDKGNKQASPTWRQLTPAPHNPGQQLANPRHPPLSALPSAASLGPSCRRRVWAGSPGAPAHGLGPGTLPGPPPGSREPPSRPL